MREALSEAAKSGEDVPVGAVVVYQDRIIARAHNERENGGGPFAHAEMLAMQRGGAGYAPPAWLQTGSYAGTLSHVCRCTGHGTA